MPTSKQNTNDPERAPLLSNGSASKAIPSYDRARGGAPSQPAIERPQSRERDEHDRDDDDEEEVVPDMTPEQRRTSLYKWVAFWIVVAVIVGVLVWQAFERGGGEFDWKGALKKAGGGVS